MIYVIKIVYTLLFPPGVFVLLLVILAAWLLQKKEFFSSFIVILTALLLYVSSAPYMGYTLLHSLEARYSPPADVKGDVLVMLTGGAVLGTPDPLTQGEGHLSPNTAARVLTIAELYRRTQLPIVLSGGQVFADTGNESQIAKRHLLALGVPESSITMDDSSRNTKENAANTKAILEQHQWKHPVLVTSAFHMPRSVKLFRANHVEVQPYPTDYQVSSRLQTYTFTFIPSYSGLMATAMALKEYVGMLAG
ncbi:YdcF family protein [Paenibacillus hexagrammi]|uniref:YdcF family protein n=1 Tax=Paenibacillus hexagrammi TaxID=2908839 RepID=A0ABY3SMK2_9BACL|nr:YdcF family protein [Paenibacillus sp. YPD9-1]UJF34708.1 YdcF family protein [Paenibacillus sp. YPD9-1]